LVYFCAVSLLTFVLLYYGMFIARLMALISYANLIWHAEIIAIIIITQEIWSRSGRIESNNAVGRSHFMLIKIWTVILLIPYFVPLASVALPADNFLIPYRPMLTTVSLVEWLTAFSLLVFGAFILRHKAIIGRERSASPLARNMEDLAF
jgi:hypothetical protein